MLSSSANSSARRSFFTVEIWRLSAVREFLIFVCRGVITRRFSLIPAAVGSTSGFAFSGGSGSLPLFRLSLNQVACKFHR